MGNIKIDELQLTSGDLSPDSESYIRELDELADGEIVGGGYVGFEAYGQCSSGNSEENRNIEAVTDGNGNWGFYDHDKQICTTDPV